MRKIGFGFLISQNKTTTITVDEIYPNYQDATTGTYVLIGSSFSANPISYIENSFTYLYHYLRSASPTEPKNNKFALVKGTSADVIPSVELKYKLLFLHGCNSGRNYLDKFQHGKVIYTDRGVYGHLFLNPSQILTEFIGYYINGDSIPNIVSKINNYYYNWVESYFIGLGENPFILY